MSVTVVFIEVTNCCHRRCSLMPLCIQLHQLKCYISDSEVVIVTLRVYK